MQCKCIINLNPPIADGLTLHCVRKHNSASVHLNSLIPTALRQAKVAMPPTNFRMHRTFA